MCSDYATASPTATVRGAFSQIKLPLIVAGAIPNLEPRLTSAPTDPAP
jgi:hypothetical protein